MHMMILLHICLNICCTVCLCQPLMHVYMTALKPCRFRPGHDGDVPLVLYDVLQAAPLYEREREREIYLVSG